jgi:flagellar basal-body rod modification protein FlgD
MTSISTSTLNSLAQKTSDAKAKAADTYNQFLTLLTTQLQNQDPLDPLKSEEFTNQLVQFSQVEQAILSNDKLDSLLTQSSNNQIGQSIGYIGKNVYYKGNKIYNEGDPIKIAYAIDGESSSAKMRIVDKDGQTVRTLEIPAKNTAGNLTWDGKDDAGQIAPKDATYTVRIDALGSENKALPSYTGVPGHVSGIETLEGILYLSLKGDTRIDATEVLSISEANEQATPTT